MLWIMDPEKARSNAARTNEKDWALPKGRKETAQMYISGNAEYLFELGNHE